MSMITAPTWVPRGYAAAVPTKYVFDEEEYERISKLAKLELDDAKEDLADAQAELAGGETTDDGTKKASSAAKKAAKGGAAAAAAAEKEDEDMLVHPPCDNWLRQLAPSQY